MQMIKISFLPCTNTKPARVKASISSGLSETVSLYAEDEPVKLAVERLKERLGWKGKMVRGTFGENDYFTFIN